MTRNILKGLKAKQASFNKDKACTTLRALLALGKTTVGKKSSSGDSPAPSPRACGNGYLEETPSAPVWGWHSLGTTSHFHKPNDIFNDILMYYVIYGIF